MHLTMKQSTGTIRRNQYYLWTRVKRLVSTASNTAITHVMYFTIQDEMFWSLFECMIRNKLINRTVTTRWDDRLQECRLCWCYASTRGIVSYDNSYSRKNYRKKRIELSNRSKFDSCFTLTYVDCFSMHGIKSLRYGPLNQSAWLDH